MGVEDGADVVELPEHELRLHQLLLPRVKVSPSACIYLTCGIACVRVCVRASTDADAHPLTHIHAQAAVINTANNADIASHPSYPDMRFRWWLCETLLKERKSPHVAHVVFHQVQDYMRLKYVNTSHQV